MTAFLYGIRKFFAIIMAIAVLVGVKSNGAETHTVLDEENCRLNAFVVSDVHIESTEPEKTQNFGRMLKDIKNSKTGNDAMIFLGDNTMNGQQIEHMIFFGVVNRISPAKNTIVAMGNHEVGNAGDAKGYTNYEDMVQRYYNYSKVFLDNDISKPYFYKVINGYYFIVLGTESSTDNYYDISDEQLTFLKNTMDLAAADGKPIFVLNHHPVTREAGDKTYSVMSILSQYRNVYYFYGHTHAALSSYSVRQFGTVTLINLPQFTAIDTSDETGENSGVGFALEVYDDEVVIRARDCYDGKWLENYEYRFPIF